MPYGLYISAAGAAAQSQRLEVLTHNLANVDTPGFKRELAVLQARHAEEIERGELPEDTGAIEDVGGGVNLRETVTEYGRGPIKKTDIPTDLAIDGQNAFFLVEKEGQQLLTRAGNFRVAADGRLLTQQGHQVLSEDSQPVVIDPTLPYEFREHGAFQQNGGEQTLALVRPEALGDLQRAGENYFKPQAAVRPVPLGERRVVQGHLEQSAVNPSLEMMQLIETSRAYEANIQMIQNQDQMLGSLVNRILQP